MQYYRKPDVWIPTFGRIYICNHPYYSRCTLYDEGDVGVAVIQQRFDNKSKHTWWSDIDPWLANDIYTNLLFPKFFADNARPKDIDGLYPTFCVRPLMRALGMPPLRKQIWETRF